MRDIMTIILVIAFGFGAYFYFFGDSGPSLPGPMTAQEMQAKAGGEADIGNVKFKLTNQFGEQVTERTYRNSKSLVFFGFTRCPSICPTALSVITDAYTQLGSNVDEIKPIFITIDPENDTPEVIQEYLLNFNKDIVGLTGSRPEIEKVVKAYKAYAGQSPEGEITHSDLIYLMDENGKYITHFNRENTAEDIVKEVKKHR